MEIKALTLWQPWATLVAEGLKHYETRSWTTDYRGWLAIHAAQKCDSEIAGYCRKEPFRSLMEDLGYSSHQQLTYGSVLAVAWLARISPTVALVERIDDMERQLGDWSSDRWAWNLSRVIKFDNPIPVSGRQRLWPWVVPAEHAIRLTTNEADLLT